MTEISIFQTQKMSDSQRRTQINTPIAETVFSLYIHSTQHESLLPRLNSSSYSFNLLPFYFSQVKEEKSWYFNKNSSHPHVKWLCLPLAFSHWGSLRGACCLSVCPSVRRPRHSSAHLLEPFSDGSYRSHSTGQGREHVPIWANGTVEISLLKQKEKKRQRQ